VGVVGDGQLDHFQAVFGRGDVKMELVRWQASRDKDHALQSQSHPHFLGRGQMTDVNGVESASQDSYPHERLLRR